MFKRLGARRTSVFQRLGDLLQILCEGNQETHNLIPSRKETGATLKVNKTLGCQKVTHANSNYHEEINDESSCSSHHITINEKAESDLSDDEIDDAPLALEDGVQATVDELKEVNLGTSEDPRPTFVSTLLTPEEEEEYVQILSQYRDVFAWSYKEMPGLDPKIAMHRLAINKGSRPVK